MFVPGLLFQPSLMSVRHAGDYPREAPLGCSTLGRFLEISSKGSRVRGEAKIIL